MKKILIAMVCLIVVGVQSMKAQGLTATLQIDGRMFAYYGVDAFKEAYDAASNGAVITLSAGMFNTVDSITKQVTIIGNGCVGDGRTRLNYMSKSGISAVSRYYSLLVNANNVRIEGIDLRYYTDYNNIIIRKVSNLKVSHCSISRLIADHNHTNTIIDQCYVFNDYSIHKSENMCFKNCYINEFYYLNSASNLIYFTNCYIPKYYYSHSTGTTSTSYSNTIRPYAVYKNCILGYCNYSYSNVNSTSANYFNGYFLSPGSRTESEYYNNVFFLYPYNYDGTTFIKNDDLLSVKLISVPEGTNRKDNHVTTYADLIDSSKSWYEPGFFKTELLGDDGKQVGYFGGTGFSPNPSIPRITDSTIDSYTDASGKINVKIKVASNQ